MKTEKIIEKFKKNIRNLIDDLDLFENTKGAQGSCCLISDRLYEMLHWSDEEIIEYQEEHMGFYLIDKEEYLANKKEKTN